MMFIKKLIVWWDLKTLKKDFKLLKQIQLEEEDSFKANCFHEYCEQIKKTHTTGEDFLANSNTRINNQLLAEYYNASQSLHSSRERMFSLLQARKEGKV